MEGEKLPGCQGFSSGSWVDNSGPITVHPFFSSIGSHRAWGLRPVQETGPLLLGKWLSRGDSVSPPAFWVSIEQHLTGVECSTHLQLLLLASRSQETCGSTDYSSSHMA